jgi:hypothetical protein
MQSATRMSSDQCIILACKLVQERIEGSNEAAETLRAKLKCIYKFKETRTPRVVLVPEATIEEVDIGNGWSMHGTADYTIGYADSKHSSAFTIHSLRSSSLSHADKINQGKYELEPSRRCFAITQARTPAAFRLGRGHIVAQLAALCTQRCALATATSSVGLTLVLARLRALEVR